VRKDLSLALDSSSKRDNLFLGRAGVRITPQPLMSQTLIIKSDSGGTFTVVAAVITFFAIILAALIQAFFGYRTVVAECQEVIVPTWRQQARENGWIPKDECPWHPVDAKGTDASGKSIKIRINILSEEYRWVFASPSEIELGGKEADLPSFVRGLDTTNSIGIICMGTASVEGKREEQEILARDRADKLLAVVREELKPGIPMFGINLGKYRPIEDNASDPKKTATQRRVIILEILEEERNVDRKEALLDALVKARLGSSPIPFDVRNYFSFDLYQAKF